MTSQQHRAIILLPGSERLKVEPGSVGREKPVKEKGASLDLKPALSKKTEQLQGTVAERNQKGLNRTETGKRRKTATQNIKNRSEATRSRL